MKNKKTRYSIQINLNDYLTSHIMAQDSIQINLNDHFTSQTVPRDSIQINLKDLFILIS